MTLPPLDNAPIGKPHDWSYRKIMQVKGEPVVIIRPESWINPYAKLTAPRDQDFRGTCVGQSTAYAYDMLYMMLTKDTPTTEDVFKYKRDVVDVLGTTHDVLYPTSASAEGFYQVSRTIGNVTYPAGSETRFAARAWQTYGANLETQWHTDKKGTMVWDKQPRETSDGGLSPEAAKVFASSHRAEGWAMLGTPGGNSSWDEVCNAIYEKGFVISGIPVYENYGDMQGGDGTFPEPKGNIVGYHALLMYGYTPSSILLLHSWGTWCSKYGAITKSYFNFSLDSSVYLVVLDKNEVLIARDTYATLNIIVKDNATKLPLPATLMVNGTVVGKAPMKIAVEPGKLYEVLASYPGYYAKRGLADGGSTETIIELDAIPEAQKTWWQRLIEWIKKLFGGN